MWLWDFPQETNATWTSWISKEKPTNCKTRKSDLIRRKQKLIANLPNKRAHGYVVSWKYFVHFHHFVIIFYFAAFTLPCGTNIPWEQFISDPRIPSKFYKILANKLLQLLPSSHQHWSSLSICSHSEDWRIIPGKSTDKRGSSGIALQLFHWTSAMQLHT